MAVLPELVRLAKGATLPTSQAPWPGTVDTALWFWRSATPQFWQDEYDTGLNYAAYLNNPGVWGLTGLSYTAQGGVTALTPGWTMGEGGRFDLRFQVEPSLGYRLWAGMTEPLAWARLVTDRTAARLDPEQAVERELPRLAEWGNLDPVAAQGLPLPVLRRAIRYARRVEAVRGTEASAEALGRILGAQVQFDWHDTRPFTRVVTLHAAVSTLARAFLRRHVPPHLGVELHTYTGSASYTGLAYTAVNTLPDRRVPAASILSVTSTLTESVEAL